MGKSFLVFFTVLTAVCLLVSPAAAYKVTLVGEVNDNHQFVADNEIYEVKNNAVGDDLVLNYVSQKVKVVGILKETRGSKIITVESFEVVDEQRVKSSEVDMGPYDSGDVEKDEDDQILGGGNKRFAKGGADQPKRSPIRRKDKWRQEEGTKPKARRNHKKIQHRLKYDWQGD